MRAAGERCGVCGEMLVRGDAGRVCINQRCPEHLRPVAGASIELPDLGGWTPAGDVDRAKSKDWWR